jgi:hypothetical protein
MKTNGKPRACGRHTGVGGVGLQTEVKLFAHATPSLGVGNYKQCNQTFGLGARQYQRAAGGHLNQDAVFFSKVMLFFSKKE